MIRSIIVPDGNNRMRTIEVGFGYCKKIEGPLEDKFGQVYWKVIYKDSVDHEYFVYSVKYDREEIK